MIDQKFRELLKSGKVIHSDELSVPKNIREKGSDYQLKVLHTLYECGTSSQVIVYDELPIEEVSSRIKSEMQDMFMCVDFPYEQTIGKKRVQTLLLKNMLTHGLLSHLFEAEETDFKEPTLILYHSFEELVNSLKAELMEKPRPPINPLSLGHTIQEDVLGYLDGACGRSWTHSHGYMRSPRLPKLSGKEGIAPLIRTAAVMSIDEVAASNHITRISRAQIRTEIPQSIQAVYIF